MLQTSYPHANGASLGSCLVKKCLLGLVLNKPVDPEPCYSFIESHTINLLSIQIDMYKNCTVTYMFFLEIYTYIGTPPASRVSMNG